MKKGMTRTFKGEYSQALHRSKKFPKKMEELSKKVMDLRRQMDGLGSDTYEFDRLSDAHSKAAKAYELYSDRMPSKEVVEAGHQSLQRVSSDVQGQERDTATPD